MNYYEHHIGDYAAATAHLSWDEDMAYTRLLRAYYHHERGIQDGQQYRIARASTPSQRKAVDTVLAEYFSLVDGHHTQKRADKEVARFQDKQRKAKASADARWSQSERNANASPNASPNAMRTHSEGNAPSLQTPDTKEKEITMLSHGRPRPSAEPPSLALVEPPPAKEKRPPDCPHLAVLALWAEVLPQLPQHEPDQWRGQRADHLRARWRECSATYRWPEQSDGLGYFRKLFRFVGQSPFLTGQVNPRDASRRVFHATLEWLVKPANWAKTIEGNYHAEQA